MTRGGQKVRFYLGEQMADGRRKRGRKVSADQRAEARAWLALTEQPNPSHRWTLREISRATGTPLTTVHRRIQAARDQRDQSEEDRHNLRLLETPGQVFQLGGCERHLGLDMADWPGPHAICLGCNKGNRDHRLGPIKDVRAGPAVPKFKPKRPRRSKAME